MAGGWWLAGWLRAGNWGPRTSERQADSRTARGLGRVRTCGGPQTKDDTRISYRRRRRRRRQFFFNFSIIFFFLFGGTVAPSDRLSVAEIPNARFTAAAAAASPRQVRGQTRFSIRTRIIIIIFFFFLSFFGISFIFFSFIGTEVRDTRLL